jgi:hypothetical protein
VALAAGGLVMVMSVVEDERTTGQVGQDHDVAAIGLGQEPLVEDEVLGRPGRDDPPIDQGRLLEAMGRAGQVVGRGHDGSAGLGLGLEHVHQVFLGGGIDAGDGFVEEVQVGLGGERPGQEHPPALATGQRPDLAFDGRRHPDRGERVVDGGAIGGARSAQDPDPWHAAHHDHLADRHRELPVDRLGLGNVGDPSGRDTGPGAQNLDRAGPRFEQAGDDLEQGALAGPVGADHGQERSGRDVEIDPVEREQIAVAGRDPAQPDRRDGSPGGGRARFGARLGLDHRRLRARFHLSAATTWSTFHDIIPRYVSAGGGPRASL